MRFVGDIPGFSVVKKMLSGYGEVSSGRGGRTCNFYL